MAKKQTQPPNTENPVEQPGHKKSRSDSDLGGKTGAHETPAPMPGWAADSPSESQEAAAEASSGSAVEPAKPPHPQMPAEQQAGADSMGRLMEGQNASTPGDGNAERTNGAQTAAPAELDSIDDVRRSLKEGEQQEESPSSNREVLPRWAITSPPPDTQGDKDAALGAPLADESTAPLAKPESDQPDIDELQVGEWLSELQKLSTEDSPWHKANVGVGGATGIERAAEPAWGVTGRDSQTRPAGRTQDILGGIDELSRETPGGEKASESYDNLRNAALQDFEEAPPEPDSEGLLFSLRDFVRQTLRELRPSDRRLLVAGGILGVVIVLIIGAYAIAGSWRAKVAPAPSVSLGVSHPVAIGLPGGLDFYLGVGKLQNGEWSPQGAEWLEGTEVSRWVSLPWSVQLEAVFQTLKSGDVLDLVMSNSDHLEYKIQSVQKVDVHQVVGLDRNVPCLLVMLSNNDSTERWVITALPQTSNSP